MKNIVSIIIFLAVILSSACSALPEPDDIDIDDVATDEEITEEVSFLRSELGREPNPDVSFEETRALALDNAAFALLFYDQIRSENENIIFSPLSLSIALSMTMAGAEAGTLEGMLAALQLSLPDSDVHPAFNALLQEIEDSQSELSDDMEGNEFQLNIANSVWGQAGFPFKDQFIDTLGSQYDSGIYTVDFIQAPESARVAINEWVEDETEEKIKDLIPEGAIDSLTRLVLANAIYFNGSWLHPFQEQATSEAPFTTIDDEEIPVEMMRLAEERLLYLRADDYQAVKLPYLSPDFAMTIILPDAGAFTSVEDQLAPDMLTSMKEDMHLQLINLQMPKFDFETTIDAKDVLVNLGMGDAFDPAVSDFSRMADVEDLHITDVLHKATINVDEQGTEAAAATAVIVGITSAPIDDPINLVVDRPFLFMIEHTPTGTILFMGRVLQP